MNGYILKVGKIDHRRRNMKVLILSFSSNQVNKDSLIPNKIGLTFSCVA